jgi:thiamine-phosphate pyrophosphorylase
MTGYRSGEGRPRPRFYLVTPVIGDPASLTAGLASILPAADIAALLLRLADADERTLINRVKTIAPTVQERDVALVVGEHARVAVRAGADGAHLTGVENFSAAVAGLKPGRIAGAGGLPSRHDAMLVAEAGADYVMFGEPDASGQRPAFDAIVERVAWWAEVFETPCVGYAASLDEIAPLAGAGADFVAVGDCIFGDGRGAAVAMAEAARKLAKTEPVA